jgi:hypothetical protein
MNIFSPKNSKLGNSTNGMIRNTPISNNVIKPNASSFITAPIASTYNAISEPIASTYNAISEPIMESINSSNKGSVSPFISVPVIIGLGILFIILIIFIIFRQQITNGLSLLWTKLTDSSSSSSSSSSPPPPSEPHSNPDSTSYPLDTSAVANILPGRKEVFNIATNKYKYSDAEPLCKAFGAELATYDQVKEAWKKGADWCNYGWVKGQSAIYPTQETTYNKLQNGPEDQRMSCGITGINGGYFDNPDMQFGVNCYGSKPSENESDISHMASNTNSTPQTIEYDRKVSEYKNKLNQIPVNPFQPHSWFS